MKCIKIIFSYQIIIIRILKLISILCTIRVLYVPINEKILIVSTVVEKLVTKRSVDNIFIIANGGIPYR